MTLDEAYKLMRSDGSEPPTVTVTRNYGEWTGQVIGVVDRPALILRTEGDQRVIVLDGASVASRDKEDTDA